MVTKEDVEKAKAALDAANAAYDAAARAAARAAAWKKYIKLKREYEKDGN